MNVYVTTSYGCYGESVYMLSVHATLDSAKAAIEAEDHFPTDERGIWHEQTDTATGYRTWSVGNDMSGFGIDEVPFVGELVSA